MVLPMKGNYILLITLLFSVGLFAQTEKNTLEYSGQLSAWSQYTPDITPDFWLGARYIPQLNYKNPLKAEHLIDFELSANILGEMGTQLFDQATFDGKVKPYRAWMRYSNNRTEIRLGLQKINFGSSQMFRPLMWFDQMDPRDPLQLTDGVWGLLGRYYFQNNANIWIWGLYGNKNRKGWEIAPVSKTHPEVGGRIQLPIPHGETALSYHFRMVDFNSLSQALPVILNPVAENRLGIDTRLDVVVGLWLEASWTSLTKNWGMITHQEMITIGTDYTFGIGNGITTTFEQMIFSYDQSAFAFANTANFSGLSLSYPVGLSDNLSAMTYYDWTNHDSYFFLNWQKQFNHISFYVMGYLNPRTYALPGQMSEMNRFSGKGLQLMLVWNH